MFLEWALKFHIAKGLSKWKFCSEESFVYKHINQSQEIKNITDELEFGDIYE